MLRKTGLTEEKRQYFKNILTQTLNGLLAEKGQNKPRMADVKDAFGDFADLASVDTDYNLNIRFIERESRLAERIADALKKFEDGTYGICEECSRPIPEKRLLARPIARLCIKCKEEQEKQEVIWKE